MNLPWTFCSMINKYIRKKTRKKKTFKSNVSLCALSDIKLKRLTQKLVLCMYLKAFILMLTSLSNRNERENGGW